MASFLKLCGYGLALNDQALMPTEMLVEHYSFGLAPNDRLLDADGNAQRALWLRTGPK